jgi:hypothetical protein
MTESAPTFEPRPAYPELLALAAAMRPDWNRTELRDAMTAVHLAGWAWRDVYREVMRLAWTEGEAPATLRNSARRPGTAAPAPLDRDLFAALRAGDYDAAYMATHDGAVPVRRPTGPMQRLTDENDNRQETR